ncbi:Hpt domain-containing protein [Acidovorax sp. SRB_24]|uniref:hybrid sensor histidine kinase/response regulator n=1 Tax=Acidovorax sp. SRB_24 TaxID=1962700 RepID=UPI00145D758C|nr:Hpt domain-containing protein [Acidovorax sp. SRB_24]NMM76649.1 hybrid sensor histidine kinase/response regulator [Acidovorax sp. SRB_24]
MSSIDAVNAALTEGAQDEQDLGPLAWVLDELRKSLDGAVKALRRFVHDAELARGSDLAALDASALRIARQQLHQACGALEMVGMASPALVLRAMETAVQRFVQRPEMCTDDAAGALERASFALSEYLESVLAGKFVSAVTLFPQYRDVQALAGADRVHPADLWPAERRFREPQSDASAAPVAYGVQARARLDQAVLRMVKEGDFDAARDLRDACQGFVAGQNDPQARAFWKIGAGFFEAFSLGLLAPDVYVKRVASRILMQYATLAKGDPDISDRLVQDLLFFCAQARPTAPDQAPALGAVRAAFALDRFAPVDYEARRFGRFDPAVLAQARKRIAAAAETWSALAGGDRNKLKPAVDQFSLVCDSLRKLDRNSKSLAQALTQAVGLSAQSGEPPPAALAMEVATAVLYLQAVLEDLDTSDEQMADRAQRLAERLDSVCGGAEPEPLELWMEELYRRVSDHQTMGSVVDELRATLGEAERAMDQFFRNPQDAAPLTVVPGHMAQMRGVLSVLGLDQASLAVVRMRDTVERLLINEPSEEAQRSQTFEKLGNSLGALGFLIDMLSYQRALARKLFVYDEELGELRALMGRTRLHATEGSGIAPQPLPERVPVPLPEVATSVPAPPVTPEAVDFDWILPSDAPTESGMDAGALAEHEPLAVLAQEDPQHGQGVDSAPVLGAAAVSNTVPDTEDDLQEVFLEEVREVVATGFAAIEALRQEPAQLSEQTSLRRAFHTLKGSSRMVGLQEFGEAAWSLEQLLNAWLAEQKPMQPPLLDLAARALHGFSRWADDIAAGDAGAWQAAPFGHAADGLRLEGAELPLVLPGDEVGDGLVAFALEVPEWSAGAAETAAPPFAEAPSRAMDFSQTEPEDVAGMDAFDGPADDEMVPALEFPPLPVSVEEAETASELPMRPAEAEEIDFATFSAALEDTAQPPVSDVDFPPNTVPWADDEHAAAPTTAQTDEPAELEALASPEAPPQGFDSLSDVEFGLEPSPDGLAANDSSVAHAAQRPFLHVVGDGAERLVQEASDEAVKVIGSLRIGIPLYNVYLNEADEWSRRLVTALQEWSLELDRPLPDVAVALAHSMAGSSATVGFTALSDTARLLEHALAHVQLQPQGLPEHAAVFTAAADEIRRLLHQFAAGFLKETQAQVLHDLRQILATEVAHTLSPPLDDSSSASEADLTAWVDGRDDGQIVPAEAQAPAPVVQTGHVAPPLSIVPPAPSAEPGQQGDQALARAVSLGTDIDDDIDAVDLIDPDLFPIFEEEATELLPHLGMALRQWTARPDHQGARSEVLRALHTLKGSSRLAGAMRLGEMSHRLESAIEQLGADTVRAEQIEPLLGSFDGLQASFDALRAISAQASADAEAAIAPTAAAGEPSPAPEAARVLARPQGPLALAPSRAAAHQSVRVRAQLLDRLVNQAGEVMISRSRLEARLGQLKGSMADLSGNLDRLRQQLRDIEVQSESQMQSRLALSKDSAAGFDPLEFDRFTRVQELTRMMAESVNDVATVQRNLQRALEGTEDELVAQGRQARELQRDLLRTRMVEFEGISERLYAVVRQSSKEAGKQVKLDITGGSIEMDRGVLDRMTPAFEHLLRNCVAHGLESPEQRLAAGKSAVGTITVDLRHEGNDVSVEFRDDGAGLDLERIRAKALAQGLIVPGDAVGDAEAASLIFMPGFTTAAEVTGLSGRGIGMDVVRSEINALGGRIETRTQKGQGAAFRMVLPLTTAVTQVVMLRADHLTVGVPANVVEIVRRVAGPELDAAYRTGFFEVAGERLPFYWAGALLQASQRSSEPGGKTRPVVVFRSASQRMALHVDEVLGNQEVVVKNLGPQLSRLPGLAGMSVLASGAVVLIYNPVALSTVYGEQVRAAGSVAPERAELAVTDMPADKPPVLPALPAAGQVPLVLVVDDSITVRRVTQRLLQREGYRVALAADGLQALERLQAERPAVVLSDIEMPRMDGFDLARNIRADEATRDLPIIMITSRIAQKHREHALELGVNHYLGKPYSDEELLSLVQHYARLATAQAEA